MTPPGRRAPIRCTVAQLVRTCKETVQCLSKTGREVGSPCAVTRSLVEPKTSARGPYDCPIEGVMKCSYRDKVLACEVSTNAKRRHPGAGFHRGDGGDDCYCRCLFAHGHLPTIGHACYRCSRNSEGEIAGRQIGRDMPPSGPAFVVAAPSHVTYARPGERARTWGSVGAVVRPSRQHTDRRSGASVA
jgi:hypothetical protein